MDSQDKKDMLSSLTLLSSFDPEKLFVKRTFWKNGFLKIHHMLLVDSYSFLAQDKMLSVFK